MTILATSVIFQIKKVSGSRTARTFVEDLPDEEPWLSNDSYSNRLKIASPG